MCVCSVIHLCDVINQFIPVQNLYDSIYMGLSLLFVFVYVAFVLGIREMKCNNIYNVVACFHKRGSQENTEFLIGSQVEKV